MMVTFNDTLDYKVHFMLELMWAKAIENNIFEVDQPIWPVDESIKY